VFRLPCVHALRFVFGLPHFQILGEGASWKEQFCCGNDALVLTIAFWRTLASSLVELTSLSAVCSLLGIFSHICEGTVS
jgi:hypothetical protein